eukprot:271204_1
MYVYSELNPWKIKRKDFTAIRLEFNTLRYPLPVIKYLKPINITNNSITVTYDAVLSKIDEYIAMPANDSLYITLQYSACDGDDFKQETKEIINKFNPQQQTYICKIKLLENGKKYTINLQIYSSIEPKIKRTDFKGICIESSTFHYGYPIPNVNNVNVISKTYNCATITWEAKLSKHDEKVTSEDNEDIFMSIESVNDNNINGLSPVLIKFDRKKLNYSYTINKLNDDTNYKMKVMIYDNNGVVDTKDYTPHLIAFKTMTYPLPQIVNATIISITDNSVSIKYDTINNEMTVSSDSYDLFMGLEYFNDDEKEKHSSKATTKFSMDQNEYEIEFNGLKNNTSYKLYIVMHSKECKKGQYSSDKLVFKTFEYPYPIPTVTDVKVDTITNDSAMIHVTAKLSKRDELVTKRSNKWISIAVQIENEDMDEKERESKSLFIKYKKDKQNYSYKLDKLNENFKYTLGIKMYNNNNLISQATTPKIQFTTTTTKIQFTTTPTQTKNSGSLYAFGYNGDGRLGLKNCRNNNPTPMIVDPLKKCVEIAAFEAHSLVIDNQGQIYAFGNDSEFGNESVPYLMKPFTKHKAIHVAVGGSCSLILTENGNIWSMGRNKYTPTLIEAIKDDKIIHISCGYYHNAAIDEKNTLMTWGKNDRGQCGLGKNVGNTIRKPTVVKVDINNKKFASSLVECGYRHTLVLTTTGNILSFGDDEYGQLGHGNTEKKYNKYSPKLVKALSSMRIMNISAGWYHSLCVSEHGDVYTFGCGERGRLGHGNESRQKLPKKIEYFTNRKIQIVSCQGGSDHSAVVSANGDLYTFGYGTWGEIGNGKTDKTNSTPIQIKQFKNGSIGKVELGSNCSFVVVRKG